jgi:hypothetical protein
MIEENVRNLQPIRKEAESQNYFRTQIQIIWSSLKLGLKQIVNLNAL